MNMINRVASLFFAGFLALATPALAVDKRTPPPDLGTLKGKEAEAFYLGLNAVIWGYPAVKFEELMEGRTRPEILKLGNPQSAVNQFGLVRQLRGPEFKQIATPNNDTLYAQAFCDLSREPVIVSVPKVDDKRYYTLQLWDPNGDTFGYIGSRATGSEAGHYALVGPGWKGALPPGVKRIDSPYDGLAIWGRIGVDGPGDLKNALAIQDQLRLTPLSQFDGSDKQTPPDLAFSDQRVAAPANPQNVTGELYFYVELANSLKHTPPKAQDAVVAESLSQIGFKDNNTVFDANSLSEAQKSGLSKAVQFGQHIMDVYAQSAGESVNGWRWSPKSGIMGNDYLFRAAFAKWFTGGNAPEEAIYLDARNDDKGQPFAGSKKYRIHFDKGQLPPAKAFWSISMYNIDDGSFVENPIKRYTLGDRTPGIMTNSDGSFDVYLQHEAPSDAEQQANWLPSPVGGFYLNLRLYGPDDSLQTGKWKPPVVRSLD
jgi:hypothetical protein